MSMRHNDVDQALNDLAERVIGAAIEVHRHLGAGFVEKTYQKALMIELRLRGIAFAEELPIQLSYKDESIGDGRIDLLVEDNLVVELKACEPNPDRYRRQVTAYLKATGLQLGLVINFEADVLKDGIARVAHTHDPV